MIKVEVEDGGIFINYYGEVKLQLSGNEAFELYHRLRNALFSLKEVTGINPITQKESV